LLRTESSHWAVRSCSSVDHPGPAAGTVESIRLDPDLKRDLLLRAAHDHASVSDIIRRAIGEYLHAS
jgi:hypothetical protein